MVIMLHITVNVLNERRPMVLYVFTTISFIIAQLIWVILGPVICLVRFSNKLNHTLMLIMWRDRDPQAR